MGDWYAATPVMHWSWRSSDALELVIQLLGQYSWCYTSRIERSNPSW
jgi:hypothetical protein